MKSNIGLTVCEYSPSGDGFGFDSNHFLHDAYGVLDSPINIGLISFSDNSLHLLREYWSSISFQLDHEVSYPSSRDGLVIRHTDFFFLRPIPDASLNSSRHSSSSFTLKSQV